MNDYAAFYREIAALEREASRGNRRQRRSGAAWERTPEAQAEPEVPRFSPREVRQLERETEVENARQRARREYSPLPDEFGPLVPITAMVGDLVQAPIDATLAREANDPAARRRLGERDARWERGAEQAGEDILAEGHGGQLMQFFNDLPGQMEEAERARLEAGGEDSPLARLGAVAGGFWTGMAAAPRDARGEVAAQDAIRTQQRSDAADAMERGDDVAANRAARSGQMAEQAGDVAAGEDFWYNAPWAVEFIPGVGLVDIGASAGRFGGRQAFRAAGQEAPEILARPSRFSETQRLGARTGEVNARGEDVLYSATDNARGWRNNALVGGGVYLAADAADGEVGDDPAAAMLGGAAMIAGRRFIPNIDSAIPAEVQNLMRQGEIGPDGARNYTPRPRQRLTVDGEGRVAMDYEGSFNTGDGASVGETRSVMRGAREALDDDIATTRRSEYSWTPNDERQAALYRRTFERDTPTNYAFSETPSGEMRLRRLGAEFEPDPIQAERVADDAPFGFEGAPGAGRVIDAEATPAPQRTFEAAVRDPETGRVYTGQDHLEAIDSAPDEAVRARLQAAYEAADEDPSVIGFQVDGQFMSREDGLAALRERAGRGRQVRVGAEQVNRDGTVSPRSEIDWDNPSTRLDADTEWFNTLAGMPTPPRMNIVPEGGIPGRSADDMLRAAPDGGAAGARPSLRTYADQDAFANRVADEIERTGGQFGDGLTLQVNSRRMGVDQNAPLFNIMRGGVKIGDVGISADEVGLRLNPRLSPEFRRQGIGTQLYQYLERVSGQPLSRSDNLTEAGAGLWRRLDRMRAPDAPNAGAAFDDIRPQEPSPPGSEGIFARPRRLGEALPGRSNSADPLASVSDNPEAFESLQRTRVEQTRTRREWTSAELEQARQMQAEGASVRAIGAQLGRSPGDVSRRLRGGEIIDRSPSGASAYVEAAHSRVLTSAKKLAERHNGRLPGDYANELAVETGYSPSYILDIMTAIRGGSLGDVPAQQAASIQGVRGGRNVNLAYVAEHINDAALSRSPEAMMARLNAHRQGLGLEPTTINSTKWAMTQARRDARGLGEADRAARWDRERAARTQRRSDLPTTGYHATTTDVQGALRDGDGGLGPGAYHSTDPDVADHFLRGDDGQYLEGANIVPERLPALERYASIDDVQARVADLAARRGVNVDDPNALLSIQEEVTAALKAEGYVGIRNPDYAGGGGELVTWDASNRRAPWARMSQRNRRSSDPLAAAAITAGGATLLADEAQAQEDIGLPEVTEPALNDAQPEGDRQTLDLEDGRLEHRQIWRLSDGTRLLRVTIQDEGTQNQVGPHRWYQWAEGEPLMTGGGEEAPSRRLGQEGQEEGSQAGFAGVPAGILAGASISRRRPVLGATAGAATGAITSAALDGNDEQLLWSTVLPAALGPMARHAGDYGVDTVRAALPSGRARIEQLASTLPNEAPIARGQQVLGDDYLGARQMVEMDSGAFDVPPLDAAAPRRLRVAGDEIAEQGYSQPIEALPSMRERYDAMRPADRLRMAEAAEAAEQLRAARLGEARQESTSARLDRAASEWGEREALPAPASEAAPAPAEQAWWFDPVTGEPIYGAQRGRQPPPRTPRRPMTDLSQAAQQRRLGEAEGASGAQSARAVAERELGHSFKTGAAAMRALRERMTSDPAFAEKMNRLYPALVAAVLGGGVAGEMQQRRLN